MSCHWVIDTDNNDLEIVRTFGCPHPEETILQAHDTERQRRRQALDDMLAEDGQLPDEALSTGFKPTR